MKELFPVAVSVSFVTIEFESKFVVGFEIIEFLVKPIFKAIFHTRLRITQEPLIVSTLPLFHLKERYKTYQNHNKF